ncbi:SCY1-like protein 2, partial [Paragonimus westermani]
MMHCNINPNAILIASGYKWKLGGLYFLEKIVDTTKTSPKFTGYSTKFPRASQPNLDYVAPEAQLYNSMSPLADMFSLGMVLCAIHNDGRSLIEADNNPNVYIKKLPELKVFNEPTVLSYEGILSLESRSMNQKKEFFNRFAKVVPEFQPVSFFCRTLLERFSYYTALRYERILPILLKWYDDSVELAPFVLPSFLTMVHVSEKEDFDVYLREHLVSILSKKKTLQVRKLSSLTDDAITKLKVNILECLEILLGCLSSTAVLEGVIPFLSQTRTTEPTLLSCILAIDKHLLAEKKFGLTCTIIAEKLLPPLMDVLTAPSLNLNE